MSKRYHLFISHSWNYTDAYEKLIALLDKTGLVYSDYSVPKELRKAFLSKNSIEIYKS